jgi:hypothetical protein
MRCRCGMYTFSGTCVSGIIGAKDGFVAVGLLGFCGEGDMVYCVMLGNGRGLGAGGCHGE